MRETLVIYIGGKHGQKLWESWARRFALSPAPLPRLLDLGINGLVFAQAGYNLSRRFPPVKNALLALFGGVFSPLYTGPIKITTKYISNIGVVS